ncbi:MAG TPA: flavin reductase family protein [Longimicrobiales bacterium]|nr:flavin reductase family protein [Longimicrobiales bacterium]
MAVTPQDFREALARWASGVTVVAYRHDHRVVATTVSAFMSLSLEPPLVLVGLSANATVLPFLQPGAAFGISILAGDQKRIATVFADPFPVGPSPFPIDGPPVVTDALVGLACTVRESRRGGDHTLVTADVGQLTSVRDSPSLVRFMRRYYGLPGG